jgi:ferredoxin
MAKLILNDEPIEIEDGAPLKPDCEEAGLPFACEEGICGTCIVEVEEGMEHLSSYTEEERDFLGEEETGERLACQCRIQGGCVSLRF